MDRLPENEALKRLIDERLDEVLPKKLAELKEKATPSMTIIATKGTLDWAYPPLILSTTAAALGWNVSVFFTFYGLQLLRRDLSHLKVSPLGNPGMPMKMPSARSGSRTSTGTSRTRCRPPSRDSKASAPRS
jgi:hypothetical protein